MSTEVRVGVLGGGVSGLSLAWRLASRGVRTDVVEAGSRVGGLARSEREDGYSLDIGPHSFFSEDRSIRETVLGTLDSPPAPAPRRAKLLYEDRYLDYPPSPRSLIGQMGLASGLRAGLSYLGARARRRSQPPRETDGEDESLETWAISHFGEHLYRRFFEPYTEQFWGVPCSDLSSRCIPTHLRLSLTHALRALWCDRGSAGGSYLVEREALPTYYPDTGFGEIAEGLARAVEAAGGRVQVGCRVTEVREIGHGEILVRLRRSDRDDEMRFSHVVSTLPLNRLVPMLFPPPPPDVVAAAERLEYRALLNLGMVTEKRHILGCGYLHLLGRPYTRVTEMNEFSTRTSPTGENILAVEIPCRVGDETWNLPKERLHRECAGGLERDGHLGSGEVKRLVLVKDPFAYPFYRRGYRRDLDPVLGHILGRQNLSTLGRTGEFLYMDVDQCVGRAFDLAEAIVGRLGGARDPGEGSGGDVRSRVDRGEARGAG